MANVPTEAELWRKNGFLIVQNPHLLSKLQSTNTFWKPIILDGQLYYQTFQRMLRWVGVK